MLLTIVAPPRVALVTATLVCVVTMLPLTVELLLPLNVPADEPTLPFEHRPTIEIQAVCVCGGRVTL
jgi:hypothetical protein